VSLAAALFSHPVRQIAYFCADVRAAATRHHALFGSGPYFVADHIPLGASVHRGAPQAFDHSSAYGQWGEVMVEFMQQNNPGPSACHDLYPEGSGRFGLHHLALWVEDVDAEVARLAALGFPLAQRSQMTDGFTFAFVDTSAMLGHMIELYTPTDALTGFYAMVAKAARAPGDRPLLTTISMR